MVDDEVDSFAFWVGCFDHRRQFLDYFV